MRGPPLNTKSWEIFHQRIVGHSPFSVADVHKLDYGYWIHGAPSNKPQINGKVPVQNPEAGDRKVTESRRNRLMLFTLPGTNRLLRICSPHIVHSPFHHPRIQFLWQLGSLPKKRQPPPKDDISKRPSSGLVHADWNVVNG